MDTIQFEYEGKSYWVGMAAFHKNLPIKLPDGRILTVTGGWQESMPPRPLGLQILECAKATEVG
jgi:hypothetical protein